MTTDAEITADFWKHLRSDRVVLLGLEDSAPTALRPMNALLDGDDDRGLIGFFSPTDSAQVKGLGAQDLALFAFSSKGHDVFAAVQGPVAQIG